MDNDIKDCITTPEQTKEELEFLEKRLGFQLGIKGDIRSQLLEMESNGLLSHSDDVKQWQQTYASHIDWEDGK